MDQLEKIFIKSVILQSVAIIISFSLIVFMTYHQLYVQQLSILILHTLMLHLIIRIYKRDCKKLRNKNN